MDGSGRPLTAKEKRQEQLKRWENSATDSESAVLSNSSPKVKFDDGAVFLAACSSGDLKEVGALLNKGADINFANVDGLTALHQACIDGNLDVVEYLVQHEINIDQEDNEGWTPLHATASCGYMDIARFLVEHGANVAAVNSEGEVPLDIAEEDDMIDFLQQEIENQGLDIEAARNQEREVMVNDATQYLNAYLSGEKQVLFRHPKSGATALHVAAAKGYIDAIKLLLQAGVSANVQDNDGWTPLHAASHWSQQEAAKLLADRSASFKIRSKLGQTPSDVADEEMLEYLEELKKQQEERKSSQSDEVIDNPPSPVNYNATKKLEDNEITASVKSPHDGIKQKPSDEVSSSSDDEADSTSSSEVASSKTNKAVFEKQKKVENNVDHGRPPLGISRAGSSDAVNLRSRENSEGMNKLSQSASGGNVSNLGFRRSNRPTSLHFPSSSAQKEVRPPVLSANSVTNNRPVATAQPIQASQQQQQRPRNGPGVTPGTPTERNPDIKEGAPDTWRSGLRKTSSFDEKKRASQRTVGSGTRTQLDTDKIPSGLVSKSAEDFSHKKTDIQTARVAPILDGRSSVKTRRDSDQENTGYQRSSSYRRYGNDTGTSSTATPTFKRSGDENDEPSSTSSAGSKTTDTTASDSKPDKRRSHLQPVRDEEAEAQRKARSRMERRTRRSTQGVTLDVYEEAKRQIENMKQERESSGCTSSKPNDSIDGANTSDSNKIPHNDSVPIHLNRHHNASASTAGSHSKTVTLPSSYIPSSERVKIPPRQAPGSGVPSITVNDDPQKLDNPLLDDVDDDTRNSATPAGQSPSAKKTAAQQRRRTRNARRSTGLPDLTPDAANADNQSDDGDEIIKNDIDSVDVSKAERLRTTAARYDTSSLPERHSRHRAGLRGSDSDLPSRLSATVGAEERHANEKNYKKLYDEQCAENETLRSELAEARRQIEELESRLERAEDVAARKKQAENEKRERKALERKLAEMEKELMNSDERDALRAKNLELKQENQALARLVNKLGYPDEKQRPSKPSSMVEAFSGRSASSFDADDGKEADRESLPSDDDSMSLKTAPSSTSLSREKKQLEKTSSDSSNSSSVSEETERRGSFSDKYASASSRTRSDYTTSSSRYKSDYVSKYASKGDASTERSHIRSGGSLREKRSSGLLTSSSAGRFPSSSSSPALAGSYHTIPVPASRSRYINSLPPSSPVLTRSKLASETTPTVSSRYGLSDRRDTAGGGYRSTRAYDAIKRSRSPVAFPSSANSKRVGDLMNTYRLKN